MPNSARPYSEEICPRSDLPKSMCAHCRGHAEVPVHVVRRKRADFWCVCPGCRNGIYPGMMIGHVDGSWVCPDCTTEAEA